MKKNVHWTLHFALQVYIYLKEKHYGKHIEKRGLCKIANQPN
jgi:hypothetical protein